MTRRRPAAGPGGGGALPGPHGVARSGGRPGLEIPSMTAEATGER